MQERVALEGDGLGDDERRLDDLIIAVLFLLPRAKQTKVLLLITSTSWCVVRPSLRQIMGTGSAQCLLSGRGASPLGSLGGQKYFSYLS